MQIWIGILAAISPVFATGVGAYLNWKLNKIKAITTDTQTLVNGVHKRLINRNEQLEATIQESNKEIPPATRETGDGG